MEKNALLERLVRLGATDVPGTPRLLMRHRSPEELAQLQHGVSAAVQKVQTPVKRVIDKTLDSLPHAKLQPLVAGVGQAAGMLTGTAVPHLGAEALGFREWGRRALHNAVENPHALVTAFSGVPCAFEGTLLLSNKVKRLGEQALDRHFPVPGLSKAAMGNDVFHFFVDETEKTAAKGLKNVARAAGFGGLYGGVVGLAEGAKKDAKPDSKSFIERHPAISRGLGGAAAGTVLGGTMGGVLENAQHPGRIAREVNRITSKPRAAFETLKADAAAHIPNKSRDKMVDDLLSRIGKKEAFATQKTAGSDLAELLKALGVSVLPLGLHFGGAELMRTDEKSLNKQQKLFENLKKNSNTKVTEDADLARAGGGGAYSPKDNTIHLGARDPAILAHELGHAEIHQGPMSFAQHPIAQVAGRLAPAVSNLHTLLGRTPTSTVGKVLEAGLPLAAMAPMLGAEVGATVKGHRLMKEHGASPEEMSSYRRRLLGAGMTYAALPAAALSLPYVMRTMQKTMQKLSAGAPTRGGFMMASDIPAWRPPRLDTAIQKNSGSVTPTIGPPQGDLATKVARTIPSDLALTTKAQLQTSDKTAKGPMKEKDGDMLPDNVSYWGGGFRPANLNAKHAEPAKLRKEKDGGGDMSLAFDPASGHKVSMLQLTGPELGEFVEQLRKQADVSPAVPWNGVVSSMQRQQSDIPPFRAPRLDRAIQKTAGPGITPAGRLASTQRIGAPKAAAPPGPSIADVAKPKGMHTGKGIAGAFKGSIGGTAPVGLS